MRERRINCSTDGLFILWVKGATANEKNVSQFTLLYSYDDDVDAADDHHVGVDDHSVDCAARATFSRETPSGCCCQNNLSALD